MRQIGAILRAVGALPTAPTRSRMCLRSGTYFDLVDPKPEMVNLEDIAHALSMINRYGGHTCYHYSVAEHSVIMSYIVPPLFAKEALLHDAHEAFVGDMIAPLKALCPDYAALEQRVGTVVAARFGLPQAMSPEVRHADRQMVRLEQRFAMENADAPWVDATMPEARILNLCPHQAKAAFLSRANELGVK